MSTLNMADAANALLALLMACVTAALPYCVILFRNFLATHTRLKLDANDTAKLLAALDAGAGEAYRFALTHEDGLKSVPVQNASLAVGANYVLQQMPGVLARMGITPDSVAASVAARFGGLLAQDPTISAGSPQPDATRLGVGIVANPPPPPAAIPNGILLTGTATAAETANGIAATAAAALPAAAPVIALLFALGGLVACIAPPAPPSPDVALYGAEAAYDVALRQATVYVGLPACGAAQPAPCADPGTVGKIVAAADQARAAIRDARLAVVIWRASPTATTTQTAMAAIALVGNVMGQLTPLLPAPKGVN